MINGSTRRELSSGAALLLPIVLALVACHRAVRADVARNKVIADDQSPVMMTNETMFPDKHTLPDDLWIVPVPGGTLRIGVDTIGSSGAEEHTAKELQVMAEQPDDGFPDYTISVLNQSPRPIRVRWRVSGEGAHPVDARDMGTLTNAGFIIDGHLPSGVTLIAPATAEEISLWAVQDHRKEPCEGFRVSLFDAATGRPLLDDHRRLVVAHSTVRELFDPHHPMASDCA